MDLAGCGLSQVAIHAEDVERAARFYKDVLGLRHRMPDHELWTAFFRDPEHNLLALSCEKR